MKKGIMDIATIRRQNFGFASARLMVNLGEPRALARWHVRGVSVYSRVVEMFRQHSGHGVLGGKYETKKTRVLR